MKPSYYYFADKEKYDLFYNREDPQAIIQKDQKEIAKYFLNNSKPNDRVMVVSIASSIINYYTGERASSKFLLSCFYINKIEIELWRNEAFEELKKSNWIVIQIKDPTPIANGHNQSSLEYMTTNPLFADYIKMNFAIHKEFRNFLILKRANS
jgi:hypothetical protein